MTTTVHELLVRSAEKYPHAAAVLGPQGELTYGELQRKARRLADTLIAHGVSPGAAVGLSLPKSADAIVGVYGILMAGACYVPIDPSSPADRAVKIATNVKMRVFLTTVDRVDTLAVEIAGCSGDLLVFTPTETAAEKCGVVSKCWYDPMQEHQTLPDVDSKSIAFILHTSGSTGFPKGVAISHKSALTFVEMAAEFFAVTATDRLCSQAPLHFDLSVFDLYVASRQGAAIVLIPEFYSAFPKKVVSTIRDYRISVWNSVASALTLIMERGQPEAAAFDSLRVVLFSGEAMPTKYLRMLRANIRNADLYNGYGQTEANTSIVYKIGDIPRNDTWRIPIGRALPGYDVFAIDDDGHVIEADGNEGELYVCSDAVANGYWGNPEATAARFVPDPREPQVADVRVYKTGDRVRIDAVGDYLFLGRSDDMIKSRGYRIELGEIDQALLSCNGVEAGACVAIPDALIGNKLVAFVSPAQDREITEGDITSHCRQQLPSYMVPEEILVRTQLPRTSTGKVDRKALLKSL